MYPNIWAQRFAAPVYAGGWNPQTFQLPQQFPQRPMAPVMNAPLARVGGLPMAGQMPMQAAPQLPAQAPMAAPMGQPFANVMRSRMAM